MKRNLSELANTEYDLLVIGGGIYGVSLARDAALRGMRVALIEKGDFGHATSFNSLRIIHGGFRYLQHLDLRRMRESIQERKTLMRIAPHLVHPLPFLMPTFGHGLRSKAIMRIALKLNDLIGFDRNFQMAPAKNLFQGRVITKHECLNLAPGVPEEGLTGGAVWPDCQLYSSERFLIGVLKSAANSGANVANYLEVKGFLRQGNRVCGVQAFDQLAKEPLDIRAKYTLNTTGPWVQSLLEMPNGCSFPQPLRLSKAMNLVVGRRLVKDHAVGITSQRSFQDKEAIVRKGHRLFFLVPWRQYTLIGTTHSSFDGGPEKFEISEQDIDEFIEEINAAYPVGSLSRKDLCFVTGGLLPINPSNGNTQDVSLMKRFMIDDHERQGGPQGLISVISVKFTEARHVAEKVVNMIVQKLGGTWPKSQTAFMPIDGGKLQSFEDFLSQELTRDLFGWPPDVKRRLFYSYGSSYPRVLDYIKGAPELVECLGKPSGVSKGEILHAVHEEMARKLSDAVFRRTELDLCSPFDRGSVEMCAMVMGKELGWNRERQEKEVEEVRASWRGTGLH